MIVRRNDTALYESLQPSFAGVPRVKVIVDRRGGDRRSAQCPVPDERPAHENAADSPRHALLSGGYTVVRFTPHVTAPAP